MFKNLFNFAYRRTAKEAIGFYLAYFILIVLTGALIGGMAGVVYGSISDQVAFRAGNFTAVAWVLVLSFLLLIKKHIMSFSYMLLAAVAGLLALFGGGFLGLIIPSYFSTRQSKNVGRRSDTLSSKEDIGSR